MKRIITYFFTFQFLLITIISSAQKTSDPVVNSVNCTTLSNDQFIFPADWCNDVWELVDEASDEFNSTSVDLSKWDYFPGWGHAYSLGSETACPNQEGTDFANGDLAYYTNGNNHEVSNGTLKLFIKQENLTAKFADYESDTYMLADGLPNLRIWQFTSGSLVSKQKYAAGKYEIRCKIPKIDGLGPAFWLYGDHEQEIDVFEFGNKNYNEDATTSSKNFAATTHRNPTNPFQPSPHGHDNHCHTHAIGNTGLDLSIGFHTYSVEWNAFEVIFKFDNLIVYKYTALYDPIGSGYIGYSYNTACNLGTGGYQWLTDVLPTPSETMNIIVGCGVANFCSPSNPLSRGTYPATMEVDYIRVYKRVPPPILPSCDVENYTIQGSNNASNPTVLNSSNYPTTIRAHNTITAENGYMSVKNLQNAPDIYWAAGNSIEFNNVVFEVEEGATFTAEWALCDNTNLRVIPTTENNNPIVLQSTVSTGKNKNEKETQQESIINNNDKNSISPNPSSGIFTLMSSSNVQSIEVRDMLGKIVYKKNVSNNTINMDIDLSDQPKGIYILQVKNGEKVYTEKVVLQ